MTRTPWRPANSWQFSQVQGCSAIQCLECTWSRGVWIAAWHAVQNKAASTLAHVQFSTCCKHIYKQSFDFYQKIGQNSNEHLKLLRCPSEKRKTDQQPAAWSFAGKSDVSSAASTLSPWFCLVWQQRGLRIQIRFARVRCCALVCKILWIKTSYSRSFRRRMQTERPWWPV